MTLKDKACIVGIGTTKFYRHGAAGDVTFLELMCQAAKNAVEDAGIEISDIDGFSYYSGGYDSGLLASALGIPELKYSVMMTGGGGGFQGTIINAAAAVANGLADMVLCVKALKQDAGARIGQMGARARQGRADSTGRRTPTSTFPTGS